MQPVSIVDKYICQTREMFVAKVSAPLILLDEVLNAHVIRTGCKDKILNRVQDDGRNLDKFAL